MITLGYDSVLLIIGPSANFFFEGGKVAWQDGHIYYSVYGSEHDILDIDVLGQTQLLHEK